MRLGHIGHLTLIAEEIVKYTTHHAADAHTLSLPQPAWDRYVSTTLRETRDRDMQPLGGGVAPPMLEAHAASLASFSEEEDDEFPMSGAGGQMTTKMRDGVPPADEVGLPSKLGENGSSEGGVSTGSATEAPPSDQVRFGFRSSSVL